MKITSATMDKKCMEGVTSTEPIAQVRSSSGSGKIAVIVAACVVVFTVICLAIVLPMYFYAFRTGVQDRVIVFRDLSGNPKKERISIDLDANTEEFDVNDGFRVMNDFNEDVSVMTFPDMDACYLTPLNRSLFASPQDLSTRDLTAEKKSDRNLILTFRPDEVPLLDRSLLPSSADEMCDGKPLFWMQEIEGTDRVKRQTTTHVKGTITIGSLKIKVNLKITIRK